MARNNAIQIRRGADASAPTGSMLAGEPLYSSDNAKLYIATDATSKSWIGAAILNQSGLDNAFGERSDTKLATSSAIYDYVEARIAAKDALSELVDTTISSLATGNMLLYDGSDSWDNKVMSGDATINSSGALTIASGAVEGSMLNANVPGDGLEISSNKVRVDLNGASLDRSSSGMKIADNGVVTAHITNANVTNAKMANSSITFGADSGTDDPVSLGETIDIVGTANEVNTVVSGNQIQIGLPDDVTIAGNLTVSGDTVTTNVATVSIEDPLVFYASNNAGNAVDIGFYGKYRPSSTDLYCGLSWDASDTEFILYEGNQAVPSTAVDKSGTGFTLSDLRLGAIHAATVDGGSY